MADVVNLLMPARAYDFSDRQALVVADFLRPPPNTRLALSGVQNAIAQQLHSWTAAGLQRVLGRPSTLGLWSENEQVSLPTRRVYELEGLDPSTAGWGRLYNRQPCAAVVDLLRPFLDRKLVVGFELSPYQKDLCAILDVPYISYAIHPFRFMKDYAFMIESNFASLERLRPFQLNPDDIAFAAQMKAAELANLSSRPKLERDSAVLFGQVDGDAALLHQNGGFIALQDHPNELRSLVSKFETVYFKPHPYQDKNAARAQVRFLQQFSNIAYLNCNAYMLLAAPEIVQVSALTSSVLSEADVFQKPAIALSTTWKDGSRQPAYNLAALSPHFWRHILFDDKSIASSPVQLLGDTSLKKLLNISWETFGSSGIHTNCSTIPMNKTIVCGAGDEADVVSFGPSWTSPAPDHRWMSGTSGLLSFKVFAGVEASYRVDLSLAAMASSEAPLRCTISTGSVILATRVFVRQDCEPVSFAIASDMCSSIGEVVLDIQCDCANSPKIIAGIEDTRSLSVALHSMRVTPFESGEVITIGQEIDIACLPEHSPLFSYGWHLPEPGGTWSAGRKSQISIKLADTPDENLEIVLVGVEAFLTDLLPQNTLLVSVNGVRSVIHKFDQHAPSPTDIRIPLPKRLLADGQLSVHVDLDLLASHSPALAGSSPDDRDLGLKFTRLRLDSQIRAVATHPFTHIANLIGPFSSPACAGAMSRNVFDAVQAAFDEIQPNAEHLPAAGFQAVDFGGSSRTVLDTAFDPKQTGGSNVNIFVGKATIIDNLLSRHGNDFLTKRYNIVYGAFELERMPTHLTNTRYFDEYWAASSFTESSARAQLDVPVHSVAMPVNVYVPPTVNPRGHFRIPEHTFAFLFCFEIDSSMARKNPEAVLQAFAVAFPRGSEPVSLVIKTTLGRASLTEIARYDVFRAAAHRDSRVVLIEETLGRDENASLYINCDAYVSLHRAEGFGLSIAEAMGYGKPTIATGYSGNLDFMNESNSCLVGFDLTDIGTCGYPEQSKWAEPDVEDAARHMRRVFEDETYRASIASAGQTTIREAYSPVEVGRKLVNRILEIHDERR
ncbi:glycosyltransferase [Ensifer sp. Root278]|uniref:glycosyltransferase n=1 Tax=Ensifer sp. Root278 TaxID=1736509 RepID=UPI000A7BB22F|nr:glycosyltransferase [Ensifer sp. Root278]